MVGSPQDADAADRRGVLIVTTNFPPDRRAGTHRLLRFARNLDALGWRVVVLTMDPRSYRPGVPVDDRLLEEVPSSVLVKRTTVPMRASAKPASAAAANGSGAAASAIAPRQRGGAERWIRKLWQDLTTTPDPELAWWLTAVPAGAALVREHRLDVVLSSAPPFTSHLVAAEVSRRTGVPFVVDFRDPWSRAPWALEWRNQGWTGWVHRRLERFTITRAARVVLNTKPMQEDFVAHYPPGIASKFVTIPNGFDSEALNRGARPAARTAPAETLVLCHTGNLYQARDPRPLLRALAKVLTEGSMPASAFRLQLVGGAGGEFDTAGEVARLGIASAVEFIPPVSHGESLGYLRAADILLVVQPDTAVQVPVKLYEYLWARKPILALASPGAVADLIHDGRVGRVVKADDESAIAEALRTFHRQRSTMARDYVAAPEFLQQLEGTTLVQRLHLVLSDVTA